MSTTATIERNKIPPLPKKKSKISWEKFQKNYLSREDGYTYEWVNGTIEKTKNSMNRTQLFILRNLQRIFRNLLNEGKVKGELLAEADLFFNGNHRRPDICWMLDSQIDNLADPSAIEIPKFIIEIISTNDAINKVVSKMADYRAAKVEVVWQIFPIQKEIHIYSGKDLSKMIVKRENGLCSAKPVLENFEIPVSDILKLKNN